MSRFIPSKSVHAVQVLAALLMFQPAVQAQDTPSVVLDIQRVERPLRLEELACSMSATGRAIACKFSTR